VTGMISPTYFLILHYSSMAAVDSGSIDFLVVSGVISRVVISFAHGTDTNWSVTHFLPNITAHAVGSQCVTSSICDFVCVFHFLAIVMLCFSEWWLHDLLIYGIELYGNTYHTYWDKLLKLNNKRLKILQGKNKCRHTK